MTDLNWYSTVEKAREKELKAMTQKPITDDMSNREIMHNWAIKKTKSILEYDWIMKHGKVIRK